MRVQINEMKVIRDETQCVNDVKTIHGILSMPPFDCLVTYSPSRH